VANLGPFSLRLRTEYPAVIFILVAKASCYCDPSLFRKVHFKCLSCIPNVTGLNPCRAIGSND
jgi:hypothetical protein